MWRTALTLSLAAALFVPVLCAAQTSLKVAFWNVENLYDTIPSLFYDDGDYTPAGRLGWDTEKYTTKLNNLARVIDQLSPDVIGLAEVENETTVRDLVLALADDYNYIHRTGGDGRGMDLALLYRGDRFVPLSSRLAGRGMRRELLHVRGEAAGRPLDVVICHLPSRLNSEERRTEALTGLYSYCDSLRAGGRQVVVAGDFNAEPSDRAVKRVFRTGRKGYDALRTFFSPLEALARQGLGSYAYRGRWQMIDNIFLSADFAGGRLKYADCGVFVRGWMLSEGGPRGSYPSRTFTSGRYTAGFSDHLPVYVIIETTS